MDIVENWIHFKEELATAAHQYHRRIPDIQVMAVSKTRTIEEIESAHKAGVKHFGENRVEEAGNKFSALSPAHYPLSLIGHLQSNKVNKINRRFTGVHSLDSIPLAEKLSRFRTSLDAPLKVLLQANTSGEEGKTGFTDAGEFADAAARIAALPCLVLKGIMTIAPFVEEEHTVRTCFARCRTWSELIADLIDDTIVISMGMSSDFRYAIAEGSTLLRIGSLIFGERP